MNKLLALFVALFMMIAMAAAAPIGNIFNSILILFSLHN